MARRISLIVVALIGLVGMMANAQERFGGLTGTVTDATKLASPARRSQRRTARPAPSASW